MFALWISNRDSYLREDLHLERSNPWFSFTSPATLGTNKFSSRSQSSCSLIFMSALIQLPANFSVLNTLHDQFWKRLTNQRLSPIRKLESFTRARRRLRVSKALCSLMGGDKDGIFGKRDGLHVKRRRMVVVRLNRLPGFNGGGGGGDGLNSRVLGNLALAIGLTYLTMTGQIGVVFDAIGWVVDTIVSISLLVVIVPIIGIGVFLWWAGRDLVQDTCPSCGQEFQTFKSLLNDKLQSCPYCSQPFSVVDNKFVSGSVSSDSGPFGPIFNDLKEKSFSSKVVDVEAEVRDVE